MMDVLSGLGPYTVPILALAGLIVLAGLVVWLGRLTRRNRSQRMVAGHRLAVIDHIQIDETRRLVLIQRDDVQHLVVLGGGSDFLVESGIAAVHARAQQHPPLAARAVDPARAPEPARLPETAPHHEPLRAEPVRTPDHPPLDPHRFDPPRAGDPHRPSPRTEPLREPRPSRETPPPPANAARAPRATPLPPEARGPVDPRPPMISRGPARDIGAEPAPLPPGPAISPAPVAGPPFARRPLEPRVPEMAEAPRTSSLLAPLPHAPGAGSVATRAEPVVGASEPDTGARITVKVDPLFAGMAEHLEETLRRPPVADAEPVRPPVAASPLGSPAFERALEKAIDRPGRSAAPTAHAAPVPHAPVPHAAMPVHAATSAPVAPPPAVAGPVAEMAPVPPVRAPLTGAPLVKPPLGTVDAAAPEVRLDTNAESAPAVPAASVRAIDMFAPEIRLPDEVTPRPSEEVDLFEEEMASLLGRNRRP